VIGEAIRDPNGVEREAEYLEPIVSCGCDAELPFTPLEQLGVVVAEPKRRRRSVVPVLEHMRTPAHRAVAHAPARGADVELDSGRET
jgi:hypothetical protein